ncbi:AAA family ATPase [Microbaculum marinisediminis]|uniref:Helicase RepA family protein n=1 Tax=Microbaculum marinisediminis TaxID=2931392 RepID=A0AAW5R740_9HYPH|nr:helicase RepA family protein [Microbaculum sp. A6E488]MCT8974939.1 helicase RepA family protein [Microbaculum sp. A6E488]
MLPDHMTNAELDRLAAGRPAVPPRRPRLVPIAWSKIHTLPKRAPLIRGVLDRGALSVVYGGSNTGKTFFALDLTARVALDWEWRSRPVRAGAVVYIAAEGGLGIEERLTAFRCHHDVEAEGVPLYVIPEPIDLCKSDADTKLLLGRIRELPSEPKIELIVVDTLSRAMSGGNENSPDDMGRFVRHVDELRIATGAHVLVVHHAGKDDTRGARGHSLLKAAVDTEIEVTKSEVSGQASATVVKQRDHATGDAFGFRLEPVEIGQDEDGEPVTSCVVVETEATSAKATRLAKLPAGAAVALKALKTALEEAGERPEASIHIPLSITTVVKSDLWRTYAYKSGISNGNTDRARQQAFARAVDTLAARNLIGVWEPYVWLTNGEANR